MPGLSSDGYDDWAGGNLLRFEQREIISRVGLGNHGQAGTPAKGTAIAVEQKQSMDRGRCPDVCGDRTCRRLRHVCLGTNGHVPLGNRDVPLQRSVWTGRRRSSRDGRQCVHVELHNVDIDGSEGDH
jgi:hypothetical protein